jgi:hypothetical protein
MNFTIIWSGIGVAHGRAALELGSVLLPVVTANGADGISDIEGKVARVATSKLGNQRVSIDRFITEGGKGPYRIWSEWVSVCGAIAAAIW